MSRAGGRVAVVDYGGGNLASAARALQQAARDETLAAEIRVTDDPDWVRNADRIVLPGQGEIAPMQAPGLRLPQMGWNELAFVPGAHPLTDRLEPGDHGYFVHSFALSNHDPADLVATTAYGGTVPALVARGNRAGTQFHVEKSQRVGLRILGNFLRWSPAP